MASARWEFWKLVRVTDGSLSWVAASRPEARVPSDRQKLYTLIPQRLSFIANWYATEDHGREIDETLWVHELIELDEARHLALETPEPSGGDIVRLTRPEACFTLDEIDRFPVEKLLGKRVAAALAARRLG